VLFRSTGGRDSFLIENAEITKYNNKEKDCLIILDKKKRREAYV